MSRLSLWIAARRQRAGGERSAPYVLNRHRSPQRKKGWAAAFPVRKSRACMYEATAVVHYGPGLRVIAEIDQGICDFYRSLIPKYYCVKPQAYRAHITIVRIKKENPTLLDAWDRHDGRVIKYQYEPVIQQDDRYFWLNAYSEEIGDIREELGLPRYRDDTWFGGKLHSSYHITIGNMK